jgi:hypothetical protein
LSLRRDGDLRRPRYIPAVEVIEYDGGIEKNGRHQRSCGRMASSNRSSGSDRICST